MKSNSIKAAALFAVGAMLAPLGVAQGPAADIAPNTGGKSNIVLQPGVSRGAPEGANVIYSNGPYVNAPGAGFGGADASILQNVALLHTTFGYSANGASSTPAANFRLADEFTVPAGQMWYVESVKVFAYRTGGGTLLNIDDGVVRVWNGDPSTGLASVVFGDGTTNRRVASSWDNSYRALETTPLDANRAVIEVELSIGKLFKPGTYWLEYGVNTLAAGAIFAPPISITGQNSTGNGLQLAVATGVWTTLLNGTGTAGVPFNLCGKIACCWEPNLGTNLLAGDDTVAQNLALPFNFPLPGALPGGATTNLVSVASNGYMNLDNAASSDFTPTVAEFQSQNKRIAVPWDDFNAATGGSVWFNNTGGVAVATWLRIDTFSGATTQSMLQLQLFPNGAFTINTWNHELVTLRTPVFGVSAGASAPSVAIDYSLGHVGVPGTATIYESFVSGSSDLSGKLFCFEPVNDGVSASYNVSVSQACCTFASSAPVGAGCFGMTTAVTQNAIAGGSAVLTSNLPAGTVGQAMLLGLASIPGFLDLGPFGAPSCFLHHTNNLFSVPMSGVGVTTLPLPCLTAILGFPLAAQGVAIVPNLNALNVAMGDAWSLTIGNN